MQGDEVVARGNRTQGLYHHFKPFEDFNDMWTQLNDWFFTEEADRLCYPQGVRLVTPPVVLTAKQSTFEFDLSFLGYKKVKWSRLCNAYLDPIEVELFRLRWERRSNIPVKSVSMAFRRRTDNVNGSCLSSLTLSQNQGLLFADWSLRASEVTSRLAVDLLFFSKLLSFMGFEPTAVRSTLHVSLAFSSSLYAALYLFRRGDNVGAELEDATWFRDQVTLAWNNKLTATKATNYGPLRRLRSRLEEMQDGLTTPIPGSKLQIKLQEAEDNAAIRKLHRSIRGNQAGSEGDGGDDPE